MDQEKTYQETFRTWDKIAGLYQEIFMDLDLYNDTYDAFLSKLPSKSDVLEIGCGPGNITRYLLQRRPDLQLMGIDVASSMIDLARKNIPAASFEVMDCRDISQIKQSFKAIISGFCLPYLAAEDVVQLIADCSALLEPGGNLYLSTIEGEYANSRRQVGSTGDGMQVYYYREAFLREHFMAAGFGAIEFYRINYQLRDGSTEVHLVVLAKRLN